MQTPKMYKDLFPQGAIKRVVTATASQPYFGKIGPVLDVAFKIPVLNTWCKKNKNLVKVLLHYYQSMGCSGRKLKLLIELLLMPYYLHEPEEWWRLMHEVVSLIQYQQVAYLLREPAIEDHLMKLLCHCPEEPHRGYDAAYSLTAFSLWMFERGNVHVALQLIQAAVKADPTWAYPEYLFGWYGLFVEGIDTVAHFVKSVHLDWNFLQKIKQDWACKRFPAVLKTVQQSMIVPSGLSKRKTS